MYCKNCGKEIRENMKFCSGCGQPVGGSAPVPEPMRNVESGAKASGKKGESKSSAALWIIIGAFIVIAALIGAAFLTGILSLPVRNEITAEKEAYDNRIASVAEDEEEKERVLTITAARVKMDFTEFESITAEDENGEKISLPADLEDWFDDADSGFRMAMVVGSSGFTMTSEEYFDLYDDGTTLKITMTIGGVQQKFEIMIGSQFHYRYDDEGNIKIDIGGTEGEKTEQDDSKAIDARDIGQISVILPTDDYKIFDLFWAAAEETAKKEGIDVEVSSYNYDIDTEVDLIQNAIRSGCSAIIIIAIDYDTVRPYLDAANEAGIEIVVADTSPSISEYPSVGTDQYYGGLRAAQVALGLAEPGEKVGIISGMPDLPALSDRVNGFTDGLADSGLVILEPQYTNFDNDTAERIAADMVESYSDLTVIFADCYITGLPASNVINYMGLSKRVSLIMFDASDTILEELEKGVVDCLIQTDYQALGEKSMQVAVRLIKGESTDDFTYVNPIIVTPDNYEEFADLLTP